ncbi:MAG TPA: hypothetical protein VNX68_12240, partial [Nitrosopumilaceae archaeon]|nr:hypothetical protein [Nitrosopumilaceae archaeon]
MHPEIAAELAEAAKRGKPIQQAQPTPAPAPQPVQPQVEQMEQEQAQEQTPQPINDPAPESEESGY